MRIAVRIKHEDKLLHEWIGEVAEPSGFAQSVLEALDEFRALTPDFAFIFRLASAAEKSDDGRAQLSLALLADALGDDSRALRLHHAFNSRVVAIFPDRWTITRSRMLAHVNMIEHQTDESDPAPATSSMMVAAQGEFAAASSQIKRPAGSSANRAGWGEPLGEVG